MKLFSLRHRIAIAIFLLELFVITIVLWSTLSFSEEQSRKQLAQTEEVILNLMVDIGSVALFSDQYDELKGYVESLAKDPHVVTIAVLNNRNIVVVSNDFDQIGKSAPTFANAGNKFWRVRNIHKLGVIAVQFSNDQLLEATRSARKFGLTIALIGVTLIAAISWLMGYWLTRRLTVLTIAAERFESGDTSIDTRFRGNDEIAELGRTFERMRNKIREMLENHVEERTRELSQLNDKLQTLSEFDELTGVYNRRKFNDWIARECNLAARTDLIMALLVIDIDYFKPYNDHYGHAQGDQVLKQVATTLKETLKRPTDMLARFGGEEFAAILPATDMQGAQFIAQALRANVEASLIKHEFSAAARHVTVSIGVSVSKANLPTSPGQLFEEADQALYKAKASGRNCVVIYGLDTEQEVLPG
jgi:diguanylate cyclase (GGDEF)-like protein